MPRPRPAPPAALTAGWEEERNFTQHLCFPLPPLTPHTHTHTHIRTCLSRPQPQHPGGAGLIKAELGADITEKFKGGYYKHSNAGNNLQATLRVARIQGYWS